VRIDVDFDAQNAHTLVHERTSPRGFAATDEALDREREAFAARRGAEARRRENTRRHSASAHQSRVGAKALKDESVGHGQGCGLVIDSENGLIVTNAHVIKGRGVVRVTLADGRSVPGDVVGVDALTDIALVRCRASGDVANASVASDASDDDAIAPFVLPAAPPLGDSAALEVGDWVIALGNPFGLDNTTTLGIVSNLRRTSSELGIPDRRVDFLQTDCAINPGNSGGPLVNEFGEVIAITAAVRADAEGIGFAIPVNEVRRVVGLLARGQQVTHAHVGVRMVDVADEHGEPGGDEKKSVTGALIVEVFPGSPAFFAGARAGDVCVAMEGEPLADAAHVRRKVEALRPGEPLTLTVARGGRRLDLSMRAADRS
jgi:ATP-dependent RNA helicase DDX56/DBP9